MGTSIDANLAYGFGFAAGSEEYEKLVETLTRILGDSASKDTRDELEMGYAEAALEQVLELHEFDRLDWVTCGSSDSYFAGQGVYVTAQSRQISVVCGGLVKVPSLMQTGLEEELAEYAQLVGCAQLLGVDPAEIGWHLFSDVG